MGPIRNSCCFARFGVLDAGAEVHLISVSPPESLHDTTAKQSCAALEQSVGFPQRPVPAFGRQGEWCAWPGGAAGD